MPLPSRREIQMRYNAEHGITPQSIHKKVADVIEIGRKHKTEKHKNLSVSEREDLIAKLTAEMKEAAKNLEFEQAAFLRDRIRDLRTTK